MLDEDDELEHFLLSCELSKDLQSLLWGEQGACRGDEVTRRIQPPGDQALFFLD